MNCTECGFHLWSHEAVQRGAHPECVDDHDHEAVAMDLETRLSDAWRGLSENPSAPKEAK